MSTTDPQVDPKPQTLGVSPLTRGALNLPNAITISRLGLSLVLFALIDFDGWWRTAAALFVFAAATDFLDGWVARRYGLVTTLGRILDPFVDKIIICGSFVFLLGLGVERSGVNAWMVLIVIGREMFITSLRGFMEQHGLDFSASWSGKFKMVAQCAAVTVALLALSPEVSSVWTWMPTLRDVTLWVAIALTVYSGVIYVFRAAEMLRKPLVS
ncbi:CDP-diacylglycerol--glycerol-3-phosphate 3-phosphatidyltransferase [Thalassoroseus pseudoceratinae]|uniref:CDP-diacylglycerol--glycerol-3-phosphate 3-phosphatidyltransferase n=1 Tax=Thalassoroseus pseudoceratinae TaxID=2713176 RepID=UPI00141F3C48|nr:CDP-diacylglycerol--glycerol-3-phosphate 3-phosphatidyltransferase [Thalassoroseus pseudoceratinae]